MLKRIKTEIGDLAFAIGLLCLILVVLTALVMAPSFIWNFISSYPIVAIALAFVVYCIYAKKRL